MIGKLLSRQIFHEDNALLNVMELTLSKGKCGDPHFNKDRDEVIFVIDGHLEINFFDIEDGKILKISETIVLQPDLQPWALIKQNIPHQLIIISEKAKVLEVIGGHFFEGACVNFKDQSL